MPKSKFAFRSAGHNMRLLHWSLRHVEVTTTGWGESRNGIRVRRARELPDFEHNAIPSTTPERTILDLCTVLDRRDRERVLDNAVAKLGFTAEQILAIPQSQPTHRGRAALAATLETHRPGTTNTRSPDEEAFIRFLRAHGLPLPSAFNHPFELPMGTILIDAFYAEHALALEVDDESHDTPIQRDRDRRRDQELALLGVHSLRLRRDDFTASTAQHFAALLRRRRTA